MISRLTAFAALTALIAAPLAAQERPAKVDPAIRATVTFLADDAMKGRDSFTPEYAIAANYVASEMMAAGLKPGGDDGSYLQRVPIQSTTPSAEGEMAILRDGKRQPLDFGTDFIGTANPRDPDFRMTGEVVFAGFGVVDPDIGWDDYRGLDVKGKIVAVLSGGPEKLASEKRAHFSGRAAKSEAAAARGAKGVIIIESAAQAESYPFEARAARWQRPSLTWVAPDGKPHVAGAGAPALGMLSRAGAAKLFAGSPINWQRVVAAEASGASMPTGALGITVEGHQPAETATMASDNVVGVLPGSDPKLKDQLVVLTAHLDHVGVEDGTEENGHDRIYNGAIDNAIGIAMMLEIAREFERSGKQPRRTIVFTAVTAEEVGLIGSEYFARNPSVPGTMVADINIDMPVTTYPFSDVIAYGVERSTIGDTLKRILAEEGLGLTPDPVPEENYFVRSDHYSFVQAGIPSIYIDAGPAGPGKEATAHFMENHYHQLSDEIDQQPAIDWAAAQRFMHLHYRLTREIADADQRPSWTKGDFFGELFNGYGAR